jgi:small subunit ribosomal protein S9
MASTSPNRKIDKVYASAVGRRKTSAASVRIIAGKGEITVNGKPASEYFPGETAKLRYSSPFAVTETTEKYAATVKTSGGGTFGQLDSVTLGIARSLVEINEKFREALRNAGLLTRDPRKRQRRMVGMGGKSRRRKQSPKR